MSAEFTAAALNILRHKAIERLATVESFAYFNPAENNDIILKFCRANWDFRVNDAMWLVEACNRKGEQITSSHMTAEYAEYVLSRFRDHIEITYRDSCATH